MRIPQIGKAVGIIGAAAGLMAFVGFATSVTASASSTSRTAVTSHATVQHATVTLAAGTTVHGSAQHILPPDALPQTAGPYCGTYTCIYVNGTGLTVNYVEAWYNNYPGCHQGYEYYASDGGSITTDGCIDSNNTSGDFVVYSGFTAPYNEDVCVGFYGVPGSECAYVHS
jgi:hypothetical protein